VRVHYVDIARCVVGQRASVLLREHPRLVCRGLSWVETSLVRSILHATPNGPIFVTLNNTYTPYPDDLIDAFEYAARAAPVNDEHYETVSNGETCDH
jgi:hypothetical protein